MHSVVCAKSGTGLRVAMHFTCTKKRLGSPFYRRFRENVKQRNFRVCTHFTAPGMMQKQKRVLMFQVATIIIGRFGYTRLLSMLQMRVPLQVIAELATHAFGNEPAVFILDNVHLMDKMSWKLLIQVWRIPKMKQSSTQCLFSLWSLARQTVR